MTNFNASTANISTLNVNNANITGLHLFGNVITITGITFFRSVWDTPQTATISLTKIDKNVVVSFQNIFARSSSSSSIVSNAITIPSSYIPSSFYQGNNITYPIVIRSNNLDTIGQLIISVSGPNSIEFIILASNGGAFGGGGGISGYYYTSISYVTDT